MVFNPTIRRVYGSGPTHIAVSNFANRLYSRGGAVVDRANAGRKEHHFRVRRPLVVRGYLMAHEVQAFINVLKYGTADSSAAPRRQFKAASRWQLALSPTNWLLAVVRSKSLLASPDRDAVKSLHQDDSPRLFELQAELDGEEFPQRLGQLARGEISWLDYTQGTMVQADEIQDLLVRVVKAADVVLTTPAGSCNKPFLEWKNRARGIAVDEAGCMQRADLCSVWGNTLVPLFAAGDIKQLPPAVMELTTKDPEGRFFNRFALGSKVSALAFLQGSGLPVYRLRVQLRMCNDMFGLARKHVYTDLNVEYGPSCDPGLEHHAFGRAFEEYLIKVRQFKDLEPAKSGTLEPVWMHTPKTYTFLVGTSKLNRLQVKMTLDLLADFVKRMKVNAADIVVIAPYKANVEYGNRQLRKYPALANMLPLQTADSFQGCEGKMAVVIFGTTGQSVGFTGDENRLNVMVTRQQCALLLVGDKKVTGELTGKKATLDKLMKQATRGIADYGAEGQATFSKAAMLREVLLTFQERGRFFEVSPAAGDEDEEDDEELPVAGGEDDEELPAADGEEEDEE